MDQALKFGTIDLEKMEARVWRGELGGNLGWFSHTDPFLYPVTYISYILHFYPCTIT